MNVWMRKKHTYKHKFIRIRINIDTNIHIYIHTISNPSTLLDLHSLKSIHTYMHTYIHTGRATSVVFCGLVSEYLLGIASHTMSQGRLAYHILKSKCNGMYVCVCDYWIELGQAILLRFHLMHIEVIETLLASLVKVICMCECGRNNYERVLVCMYVCRRGCWHIPATHIHQPVDWAPTLKKLKSSGLILEERYAHTYLMRTVHTYIHTYIICCSRIIFT